MGDIRDDFPAEPGPDDLNKDGLLENRAGYAEWYKQAYRRLRARLASMEGREPIGWIAWKGRGAPKVRFYNGVEVRKGQELYTTPPPAPSVPDKVVTLADVPAEIQDNTVGSTRAAYRQGWNDCRNAMLTATPAPPRSESVVKAEALEWFAEAILSDERYEPGSQGNDFVYLYNKALNEAARLRSEGRE